MKVKRPTTKRGWVGAGATVVALVLGVVSIAAASNGSGDNDATAETTLPPPDSTPALVPLSGENCGDKLPDGQFYARLPGVLPNGSGPSIPSADPTKFQTCVKARYGSSDVTQAAFYAGVVPVEALKSSKPTTRDLNKWASTFANNADELARVRKDLGMLYGSAEVKWVTGQKFQPGTYCALAMDPATGEPRPLIVADCNFAIPSDGLDLYKVVFTSYGDATINSGDVAARYFDPSFSVWLIPEGLQVGADTGTVDLNKPKEEEASTEASEESSSAAEESSAAAESSSAGEEQSSTDEQAPAENQTSSGKNTTATNTGNQTTNQGSGNTSTGGQTGSNTNTGTNTGSTGTGAGGGTGSTGTGSGGTGNGGGQNTGCGGSCGTAGGGGNTCTTNCNTGGGGGNTCTTGCNTGGGGGCTTNCGGNTGGGCTTNCGGCTTNCGGSSCTTNCAGASTTTVPGCTSCQTTTTTPATTTTVPRTTTTTSTTTTTTTTTVPRTTTTTSPPTTTVVTTTTVKPKDTQPPQCDPWICG